MVIGGYDGGSTASVEVIDLANPSSNCNSVNDYPIQVSNQITNHGLLINNFSLAKRIAKSFSCR
jgi:hypothetical protein